MTPSVVRAVLMVSLVEVGRMFYRRALSLNTIAAAAVLILLARPLDIWSVSFQLSFAATASIVVFARAMEGGLHSKEWDIHWKGRALSWIIGTIVISIAAQIGTLPITMYTFGQMSPYFLLANLIVLPVASFLVPCGLISIVLGGSGAGIVFSKLTWALSWVMNHSVGWIESLPGSTIPAHVNGAMIALYYVLLLLLYVIILKKSH
jgi:competence protein ComEC